MAEKITEFKCPSCTGPLHFSSETGKLECDYCGSAYDVEEIETLYKDKETAALEAFKEDDGTSEWDLSGLSEDWGEDSDKIRIMNCPSCGAQLILDQSTAATSCPYCGNNTIVPGQFTGMVKPAYVLPFSVDQETAKAKLKEHYKGKFFLPRLFSNANHIEEMKGVYVPFWLFDCEAECDCRFEATRTHVHKSGDYEITDTMHYDVRRKGTVVFEKVPADGSSKMRDDYMDSIEPFNYEGLKPFSTAYLPGYLADKYDVSAEDCKPRADERCTNSGLQAMQRDVRGYTTVVPLHSNVRLHRGKVDYALLPVWTLHTKWNGKDYMFMMNGQTGKMVGDLPCDMKKFYVTLALLTILFTLLFRFSGLAMMIVNWLLS